MTLHELLDEQFGEDGDEVLVTLLESGLDPEEAFGPFGETALHVATRRRRLSAVVILLDWGVDPDARTRGGKTAFLHAIRRGFKEVAEVLKAGGSDTGLGIADQFAVAVVDGALGKARELLDSHPELANTGNPEEDRLLADMAGRFETDPVWFLIQAGADLRARGLDTGTALHQAAWFGQPANARLLVEAGAPLDLFDDKHESSPLHWAVHGSRYSGGAAQRQEVYVALVRMLLEAGSRLSYPDQPTSDSYFQRLLRDATPPIAQLLRAHGWSAQKD